jgi:DNA topoisomerase-1
MVIPAESQTSVDGRDAAEAAGLAYVSSAAPGLSRRRTGRGFVYTDAAGQRMSDPAALKRIRSLAIPPAWTHVWICPDANGHIQAVGYDERGRKQYRYHPKFREVREEVKFEHMMVFAQSLPGIRRQVAAHMAAPGLGRSKVLATVVHLLETTMIRVGNKTYAKENKSYGLTTLLNRHVMVDGAELRFHFKGKSGKTWRLGIRDRRIARIVKTCQEMPGQHLFQYVDDAGQRATVTSTDVNAYLKEIGGADITAKDFRTWTGTVLAAMALIEFEAAENTARAKKNITQAIERVSGRLGNTPTICRKCYIHPEIIRAYLEGGLSLEIPSDLDARDTLEALRPEETAVLAFLRSRIERAIDASEQKGAPASPTAPRSGALGYETRDERRRTERATTANPAATTNASSTKPLRVCPKRAIARLRPASVR